MSSTVAALDKIATGLESNPTFGLITNDLGAGWNGPPISPQSLAFFARQLSATISENTTETISEDDLDRFTVVLQTLEGALKHIIPNVNGNTPAALPPLLSALSFSAEILAPFLGWSIPDKNSLPSALSRRLVNVRRDLENLITDRDELSSQIAEIRQGYQAAVDLPTTTAELSRTLSEIRQASSSASEIIGRIQQIERSAEVAMGDLHDKASESTKLIDQASEAYRITTTVGLGAAFDERARSLNDSLYTWVKVLGGSLVILVVIGFVRLYAMKDALAIRPFEWGPVWVQLVISALSLGAPFWFGWIATKQIAQRFRLAEDYAFKATVAKAYEGYRREAEKISDEFTQALFASALQRLDEPPLRLLELSTHGTPLHELANSRLVRGLLSRNAAKQGPPSE